MRVLHVAPALNIGGAELAMESLCAALSRRDVKQSVLVLRGQAGPIGERLREAGLPLFVADEGMREAFARARAFQPEVVQGWMYYGALAAAALTRVGSGPRPKLVWAIRQGLAGVTLEKRRIAMAVRSCAAISAWPHAIIYNSRAGLRDHEACGFRSRRGYVLQNGFDCARFAPDPARAQEFRRRHRLRDDATLVGMLARFHPVKGHALLIDAIARLGERHPQAYFLMAGPGDGSYRNSLETAVESLGLSGRVRFLGSVTRPEELLAALDLYVSPSLSEGFPNAIGEALACGVPCIASDAGDCKEIVGEAGEIVPVGDATALSAALSRWIGLSRPERRQIGARGRARVVRLYGLEACAARYLRVFEALHDSSPAAARARRVRA